VKPGEWDPELYARFLAAKQGGPLRRLLASKILVQNEAGIKQLVAQMTGRQATKFNRLGKVYDCDRLEWDDALQAGYIGFARALETYDPSKCKILAYARWWIRYELQKQTPSSATICTPLRKENQRPEASLVDKPALEALAGPDFGVLATVEGITPEMVEAWAAADAWPETLEEARQEAVGRVAVAVPAEPPITPWNAFLRDVVRVRPAGRVPRAYLHDAYVRHVRARGIVLPLGPSELGRELGVVEVTTVIRGTRYRARGFKGVELRCFPQPTALGA